MKVQITNTATGGKSEIIDFSILALEDLKVMIDTQLERAYEHFGGNISDL